ncbi:MAG: ribonuclease J [Promethearchaeota archaeon]
MAGRDHLRVTFHGGADGIGGNKVLLEGGGTRVFLDHGQSFSYGARYFAGWLKPRERFGLRDHFALGLMPKIRGLYSPRALARTDLPHEPPAFDAVLLSHVHFDHVAHLRYVDPKIPVFLGRTTLRVLRSWETTSPRVDFNAHDYRPFRTGDSLAVGGWSVEPVHVDHSTPASYGFVVRTPDGAVAYTGDLRRHGPMGKLTDDFVEQARKASPVALICEGTRVAPEEKRENLSEEEVQARARDVVEDTEHLVVVTFYNRDVDRIRTYHRVARETGRVLVVSTRVAHLLRTLADDPGIDVPDPRSDPHLAIYRRELARLAAWEEELLDDDKLEVDVLTAWQVHDRQGEIVLHLDFHHLNELVDVSPRPGSVFVNSTSEPFTEDDVEDAVKDAWLERFNLRRVQAHASGHASAGEIWEVVERIGPQVVFPVHTEHPEMFAENLDCEVVVPRPGETYELRGDKAVS